MKKCKCGSKDFRISGVRDGYDYVTIKGDGSEDFNITDSEYDESGSEWDDHSMVMCTECEEEMPYVNWKGGSEVTGE